MDRNYVGIVWLVELCSVMLPLHDTEKKGICDMICNKRTNCPYLHLMPHLMIIV